MMMSLLRPRTALAIALAVLGVGAATALAEVVVYSNDMSTPAKFDEIMRSGGGKRCDKKYRKKSKVMVASVKKSPTTCSFRPPVQGDDALPNQGVAVDGKILSETPKAMRKSAFIETAVRTGGQNTGYALRIFPKRQRWELRRGPEGSDFPKHGHSDAINKIDQKNRIEIVATGAQISAFINGKQIAQVADSNPGLVDGRKVRFALGSQRDKDLGVVATFKRIAVSVPDP